VWGVRRRGWQDAPAGGRLDRCPTGATARIPADLGNHDFDLGNHDFDLGEGLWDGVAVFQVTCDSVEAGVDGGADASGE
jgi:hypothetical protein